MPTWDDAARIALALPGVEETTTYGRAPALKVRKKIVAWMRPEPESLVVPVEDLAEKEALLADPSGIYFTTDHYDGYAYVLIDLDRIPLDDLSELLEDAWRLGATKAAVKAFDEERAAEG